MEEKRRPNVRFIIVLAALALILLLLGTSSLVFLSSRRGTQTPANHVQTQKILARSGPPNPGLIELGYGPSTLVLANTSIPTYTLGDELWVKNDFNSSIGLVLATPSRAVAANETLVPGIPTLIVTFNDTNGFDGLWSLNVSTAAQSSFSIPITFVNPMFHTVEAAMNSYGFQGNGNLAVGFSLLSSSPSYGIEGCLLADSSTSGPVLVNAPYPGGAQVAVENVGNGSVSISTAAGVSGSQNLPETEFWLELYYLYSYESVGTPSYFSSYREAAFTNPIVLSSASSRSFPLLNTLVGVRSGTYLLRSFFEVGGNLSVVQSSVLIQSAYSQWISLASCSPAPLRGATFSASYSLSNSSSQWPSYLYLTYYDNGVNLYLLQSLSIEVQEFTLFVTPLESVPSNIGIQLNMSSSGRYEVVGESVYMVSDSGISANYSLSFGGKTFLNSQVESFNAAETKETALGRVNVFASFNGIGVPNATMTLLNNALGSEVSITANSSGMATFWGPPGTYSLTVSSNNTKVTQGLSLSADQSLNEVVSLNQDSGNFLTQGQLDLIIASSVFAIAGLVANFWFWIIRPRRMMRS